MTNSKDNETIDAIALVLHRIERKYATESLFGEMCGAAVLCLIARHQGLVNDVTDLRSLLLSIGIEEVLRILSKRQSVDIGASIMSSSASILRMTWLICLSVNT